PRARAPSVSHSGESPVTMPRMSLALKIWGSSTSEAYWGRRLPAVLEAGQETQVSRLLHGGGFGARGRDGDGADVVVAQPDLPDRVGEREEVVGVGDGLSRRVLHGQPDDLPATGHAGALRVDAAQVEGSGDVDTGQRSQ